MVEKYCTSSGSPENKSRIMTLTGYQLSKALLFQGIVGHKKKNITNFAVLGSIIDKKEEEILTKFSEQFLNSSDANEIPKNKNILDFLCEKAKKDKSPAESVLAKLKQEMKIDVVTKQNIDKNDDFEGIYRLTRLTLNEAGNDLSNQIKKFINDDGVMFVYRFTKPNIDFIKAVKEYNGGLTVTEQIIKALVHPSTEVMQAQHEFINVLFIPKNEQEQNREKGNWSHLTRILNKRIDRNGLERDYAFLKIQQAFLTSEFSGLKVGAGLVSALELFNFLLEKTPFNKNLAIQAFNKFISPMISDVITNYTQLVTFLKGKQTDRLVQTVKKMFSKDLLPSTSFNIITILGAMQIQGLLDPIIGNIIYSSIPTIGTIASLINIKKNLNLSFEEIFKENPAELSILLGAVLTTATGILTLGSTGNLPQKELLIPLIMGLEEHIFSYLLTLIQIKFINEFKFYHSKKRKR